MIIRSSQDSQIFLKCFSFFVGDDRTISGQPNAPTGTWNPGLEVSVATSPEPGHPRRRSQGEQHNGGSCQGPPEMNQRRLGEEDVNPEEETDSETAPAMTNRLQRQQSSMLLLEKVKSVQVQVPSTQVNLNSFQESFWQWLGATVVMGDEQLMRLAGPDAVQYLRFSKNQEMKMKKHIPLLILCNWVPEIFAHTCEWFQKDLLRFQKYLLIFISITTLLCICLILPFNFQVCLVATG